jgi:hypothetical protein
MKKAKGPTKPQRRLLEQFKITDIPTTQRACTTLLEYILEGNGSVLTEKVERARFVRQWTGARVKVINRNNDHHGQTGEVVYRRMRSPKEIEELTEAHLGSSPIPFVVIVRLDSNDDEIQVPTSVLRIINDRRQNTLFPLGAERTLASHS